MVFECDYLPLVLGNIITFRWPPTGVSLPLLRTALTWCWTRSGRRRPPHGTKISSWHLWDVFLHPAIYKWYQSWDCEISSWSVADWSGLAHGDPRVGPRWFGGPWSPGPPAYWEFVSSRSTKFIFRDFVWAVTIAATYSAWATAGWS